MTVSPEVILPLSHATPHHFSNTIRTNNFDSSSLILTVLLIAVVVFPARLTSSSVEGITRSHLRLTHERPNSKRKNHIFELAHCIVDSVMEIMKPMLSNCGHFKNVLRTWPRGLS